MKAKELKRINDYYQHCVNNDNTNESATAHSKLSAMLQKYAARLSDFVTDCTFDLDFRPEEVKRAEKEKLVREAYAKQQARAQQAKQARTEKKQENKKSSGPKAVSRRAVIMSMLKAGMYTRKDILAAVAAQCPKYADSDKANDKAISGCAYDLKTHKYVVFEKDGKLHATAA